jgi:hypothetical protein
VGGQQRSWFRGAELVAHSRVSSLRGLAEISGVRKRTLLCCRGREAACPERNSSSRVSGFLAVTPDGGVPDGWFWR